jgi:hypothetical protein
MMMKKFILMTALCMLFISLNTDAQDFKNAVGISTGLNYSIVKAQPIKQEQLIHLNFNEGTNFDSDYEFDFENIISFCWGLEYERNLTKKQSAIIRVSSYSSSLSAKADSYIGEITPVDISILSQHRLSNDINILSFDIIYSIKPFSKFRGSVFVGAGYSSVSSSNRKQSYNLIEPEIAQFTPTDQHGNPLKYDPTPNDNKNGDEYEIPNYEQREKGKVYWSKDYRSLILEKKEGKIRDSYFGVLAGIKYEFLVDDRIGISPTVSYRLGLNELNEAGLKKLDNLNLGCSFRYHF